MGTIRYVLRTDKPLKNGQSPLDLIFQVEGVRNYFRTEIKLYPQLWDAVAQTPVFLDKKKAKALLPEVDYNLLPTQGEIEEIKATLTDLKNSIYNIEKRFKLDRITYSSKMVVDKLKEEKRSLTFKEERTNVIFEFMERYVEQHKLNRVPGSLSVYKSVKKHLQHYCNATGRKVTFDNIDYNFFQSFQNFLLTLTKTVEGNEVPLLNNVTIAKQLSTIKTFLNYAKKEGVNISDKYKDFKIKKESLEVIALTSEEFEKLYNLDLSHNKKLEQTRDVFCFACTTGLRYSDLQQLKHEHIKAGEIKLVVTKTKEQINIPLTPYSMAILAKYKGMHKPLPVISNQNLNYNVKELCKYAGIDEQIEIVRFRGVKKETITYPKYELIGVHTGRKTFCTLCLEKGMSAEEVMSISGHRDYKSFKRYVSVTEQRKKVVMLKAWVAPASEENKLKAV